MSMRITDFRNAIGDLAARMPDDVGYDVGIEQKSHSSEINGICGQAIGGNSSSSVCSVARTDNSDLGGAVSMMSRCPSFRMMASSPSSSNSRGIRTAWFRPFLKSLT